MYALPRTGTGASISEGSQYPTYRRHSVGLVSVNTRLRWSKLRPTFFRPEHALNKQFNKQPDKKAKEEIAH